ncbi:MAG: phosphatidylserine/phosphatidylglycerophosphate/cardiolipin synthase family protein [Candidatus Sericytochromatia bacterium]|nr:phosphatidylserine/phosphatidylglycerophosphate/cardiolipin synthase family protein [Candidatus Sericytochromatia bacterium]
MGSNSLRPGQLATGLVALAAATLTACGGPGPGLPVGRPAGGSVASGPRAELSLQDAPLATVREPARPTRHPRGVRHGNWARLHTSSAETLPALKALIQSAERSVWFETFNFGNDSMGRQLYPLLIAKARQGVQVKVLADYVGSRFLQGHKAMVREMREAGVDVRLYAPRWIVKDDRRRGINIDHRKVYLADGQRALVGGVNLMAHFDTHTQDVLVEWRGPIVGDLTAEYAHDWQEAGGTLDGGLPPAPPAQPDGGVTAQVVVTSPGEARYEARDAIYAAIDGAQRRIDISNQYLWDDRLIDKLHGAVRRGVRLRMVVPGEEDHGYARALHAEEMKRLIDAGAEGRLFTGTHPEAHLHTKYFGVDEAWVAIGSTNGDTRALMDNQELDTVITNESLAREFRERMFARDWTAWSKPFVYKPGGPVTRPFRKLLEIVDYYL